MESEIFYDFEENFFSCNDYFINDGALFLDRDGVIIQDVNYIKNPEHIETKSNKYIKILHLLNLKRRL